MKTKTKKKTVLPPDPEGLNNDRATWGGYAILMHAHLSNATKAEAPADLICNILHWCDRNRRDYEEVLMQGLSYYTRDTDTEPTSPALNLMLNAMDPRSNPCCTSKAIDAPKTKKPRKKK